ncbi:hypothetical protein PoB_005467100 [Plakobranchus ocellatus]|uniref:MAM domain-containing protein n=1 Tax=Plakobranchus ocellatus TaxID=259542 RepID=A0AAV4BYD5_9GAST|nr:hypothetical protein PoB_005467100 [Plakobranchus ocellatus]
MMKLPSLGKVRLLYMIVVCTVIFAPSSSTDPDPQCTDSYAGFVACNFNNQNCYKENSGWFQGKAWKYVKNGKNGPVEPHEGGYIYLDYEKSQGKPVRLEASISSGKTAMCGVFWYATSGPASAPITILLKDGAEYTVMHEVLADTNGTWQSSNFSCCLPNVNGKRSFIIEGTSNNESVVAIDYMDLRGSDMQCDNEDLVCYPRLPSMLSFEPEEDDPTCSGKEDIAANSCDFDSEGKSDPDFCGWQHSSLWEARQKYDGSGKYDILFAPVEDDYFLKSNISDDIEALCVEIEFAIEDIGADLRNLFSLIIHTANESIVWGQSYNYDGRDRTEWKRNSLVGCLPNEPDREIELRSNTKGLKIDYIHMRSSYKACIVDPPALDVQPEVIFSCPSSSSSSFCGLTPWPKDAWEERSTRNTAWRVFPGAEYYILFSSDGEENLDSPASLSTGIFETNANTVLTFSYNCQGNADLQVLLIDVDEQITHQLWSTNEETNSEWRYEQVPINMKGRFQLRFQITSPDLNPGLSLDLDDEGLYVGFTDIAIKLADVNFPDEDTPIITEDDEKEPEQKKESPKDKKETQNKAASSGGSSNTGTIVGSIFGVFIGLAVIAGAVWWFYLRRVNSSPEGRYLDTSDSKSSLSQPHAIENVVYTP